MPRTTDDEYLQRRRDVRQLWSRFSETFMVLSPTDQWRVHDYYQTQSTATDDQLLLERDSLSREGPSLPQAAGKAYHQLNRCFQIASHYGQGDPLQFFRAIMALTKSEQAMLKQETGISIHSLVRPAPDIEQLTRAFISIAEAQREATDQDLDQAA